MSHEETVKKKLYDLWLKEAQRVEKYDKSWKEMRVCLGSGIVKVQGLTKVHRMIDTIEDFGIDMDMLDVLNPSYDELHQVYNAINSYREAVRFLKELKNDMARKNHGDFV